MLVTLAYCQRDQEITLKLFDWIAEIGSCKPRHSLWLLHDARCDKNLVQAILSSAQRSFEQVGDMIAAGAVDGWPEGANYMWRTMTSTLSHAPHHKYFLWLEPDAIPLDPKWLDLLEEEYLKSRKPFMGDRVEVEDIPLHMSGVGVYQNPVYALAGEAYRAADIAFDMAGKDQIVPHAHFTDLIEHAWKHPTFSSPDELRTQIDPKTVLFHASKDGSLISLLRQQRGGNHPIQKEPEEAQVVHVSGSPSPHPTSFPHPDELYAATHPGPIDAKPFRLPISETPAVYDIFIRTYPADYPWLQYCLRSIAQYAKGFRKVWIISPEGPPSWVPSLNVQWKKMNEESGDGYLSQQIHKLYADHITDYEADYILHIDSDTLFTRPVTPEMFFTEGKLTWYYTPYEETQTPWQPITEKFMQSRVELEFMRRLPIMVPKFLYDDLRKYCFKAHNMILSEYIKKQPYREFSEFNVLGALAWTYLRDQFHFQSTIQPDFVMPPPFARQFYSWSGISEEVQKEIQEILSGKFAKITETEKPSVAPEIQGESELRKVRSQNESALPSFESYGKETRSRQASESGLLDKPDREGNRQMPSPMSSMPQGGTSDSTIETDRRSQEPSDWSPERELESETTDHKQKKLSHVGEEDNSIPSDHIRWLVDYAGGSPGRRQYILMQLEKVGLYKKRHRGKAKTNIK